MAVHDMPGPPPGDTRGRPRWIEKGWDENTGRWVPDSPVGKMLAALGAGTSQRNAAVFGGVSISALQG